MDREIHAGRGRDRVRDTHREIKTEGYMQGGR